MSAAGADGGVLHGEPPLRILPGVGASRTGELRGQLEASVPVVGRRGAQGAPEAAKAAAFCGWSENGCARRRAEHKGHVWTYDFVIDRIEDGGRLKLLAVVDEYTRECLYLDAERSVTAKEVVKTLSALFDQRREPSFVRSGKRSRVRRPRREVAPRSPQGQNTQHRAGVSL